MNRLIWPTLRRWLYLRRGRMPPARLDGPVWYFAFGSNMNERLFRERRHMTWPEKFMKPHSAAGVIWALQPDIGRACGSAGPDGPKFAGLGMERRWG